MDDAAPLSAHVIVPAAGRGLRFGAATSKMYVPIAGVPLVVHTLRRLASIPEVSSIWLVVAPEDVERCRQEVLPRHCLRDVEVVAGGATRQESVRRGLMALPKDGKYIVVHDGARPFVTARMVEDVLRAARRFGAATSAVRVKDTVTRSDADHFATESVNREWLWRVQTPQAFQMSLLVRAHEAAQDRGSTATDDASLVGLIGGRVHLVEGDERNVKVTTPEDLLLAEALLSTDEVPHEARTPKPSTPLAIRTGVGYDIHRLEAGSPLVLGGVVIPHTHGLAGHSDGDALAHAICDALLGAAGMGDIGTLFPDTDAQYRGADSIGLLGQVAQLVAQQYDIVSVDSTVKAQAPRIGPHARAMRERLGGALGIDPERVNVKAKTGEGLGPVGRQEAIEAEAVATLWRRS